MKIALIALVCLSVPSIGFADAFQISVLSEHYTDTLHTHANVWPPDVPFQQATSDDHTTTNSGAVPLNDLLEPSNRDTLFARATADRFSAFAGTAGYPDLTGQTNEISGQSQATVETLLRFSPIADGAVTLGIDIVMTGLSVFTGGLIGLEDATTGQTLFNHHWEQFALSKSDIPWDGGPSSATGASLAESTTLLASHVYLLTLHAESGASTDQESVRITVSGLEATPEPATLLLLAMGALGAGIRRGWRR